MDIIDTIEYRGHTINIHHDESPSNPFEDWDCNPPLYAHSDRHGTGYGLDLDVPELTREQIKANSSAILAATGSKSLLALIGGYYPHYRDWSNDAADMVNGALDCYADDCTTSDRLELLAAAYSWQGVAALSTTRSGYSQGDVVDLLIVATPEWIEAMGLATSDDINSDWLASTADLYAAWAYGDVYGFVTELTEDSCWGFYGTDHRASGLLEHARNAIDCHVTQLAREAQAGYVMRLAFLGPTMA